MYSRTVNSRLPLDEVLAAPGSSRLRALGPPILSTCDPGTSRTWTLERRIRQWRALGALIAAVGFGMSAVFFRLLLA